MENSRISMISAFALVSSFIGVLNDQQIGVTIALTSLAIISLVTMRLI